MSAITTQEDNIQKQILQAAKQLFQVYGLYKVTMDDVAKAIGKGRSSLYYYYKSKDEIFDAVMEVEIKEMMAIVTHATEQADTLKDKINAFCTAKLKLLQEKKSIYNALEAGMDADALTQLNKAKLIHHRYIIKLESTLLNKIFNEAIDQGEIAQIDKEKLDTVIFILLSSLRGLKREMIMENSFEKIDPSMTVLTEMTMGLLKG